MKRNWVVPLLLIIVLLLISPAAVKPGVIIIVALTAIKVIRDGFAKK